MKSLVGCGIGVERRSVAWVDPVEATWFPRGKGECPPEHRRTLEAMSVLDQPEEPGLRFYTPDEALERARPLPPHDRLVIEDVSDHDWEAFQAAIADT